MNKFNARFDLKKWFLSVKHIKLHLKLSLRAILYSNEIKMQHCILTTD